MSLIGDLNNDGKVTGADVVYLASDLSLSVNQAIYVNNIYYTPEDISINFLTYLSRDIADISGYPSLGYLLEPEPEPE